MRLTVPVTSPGDSDRRSQRQSDDADGERADVLDCCSGVVVAAVTDAAGAATQPSERPGTPVAAHSPLWTGKAGCPHSGADLRQRSRQ